MSISSPPVSTDGAADEAEEGAVRGPEGGGGDEDRHHGPGDQPPPAGDHHEEPASRQESGEEPVDLTYKLTRLQYSSDKYESICYLSCQCLSL